MTANNPLDETLVTDLHQILQASPLLWEAYIGLPANQRSNVDDKFLELIWTTILAGATKRDEDEPLKNILEDEK